MIDENFPDTRTLVCTTRAVGVDTEWVEQVHRKVHRRSDPTIRQLPCYHKLSFLATG